MKSVNRNQFALVSLAILLLLIGFVVGRFTAVQQLAADNHTNSSSSLAAAQSGTPVPPQSDVPGKDINRLPRYPGAVRVDYREEVVDGFLLTEVDYLASADLEEVHDFYRTVFDEEGWSVADLGIYHGEWSFFVISGNREALVELEVEYGLVEVEIETSEPIEVASDEWLVMSKEFNYSLATSHSSLATNHSVGQSDNRRRVWS